MTRFLKARVALDNEQPILASIVLQDVRVVATHNLAGSTITSHFARARTKEESGFGRKSAPLPLIFGQTTGAAVVRTP